MRRSAAALAVLLACLLVAPMVLSGCGESSPQSAVSTFLDAWQGGNWQSYKEAVAPEFRKLTKMQEDLAKQKFQQYKVKFENIGMKTTYDAKDKNKAKVTLTSGKLIITAPVLGQTKTDTEDLSKSKDKPSFDVVRVNGKWYVAQNLG